MPWNTRDAMSLKEEFVALARQPGSNKRELCRRFGISPQTAYKWLERYETQGPSGLKDRSRRPNTSPQLTQAALEAQVLAIRREHPEWGGRTISNILKGRIAPSTVSNVLHRHGLIHPAQKEHQAMLRFEHPAPNDLWQMDFKGHFAIQQGRCHPLTLLDDHSRFNLAIQACENECSATVKEKITEVFQVYGLPARINVDNGPPWGSPRNPGEITELSIWMISLGIRISFSRPYHPQTNGKIERFHRSLKAEVLNGRHYSTLMDAQAAFNRWRDVYNLQRPHQA
ncbi:transposase, partial [Pseudomonas fluorescens ABAC62]